MATWNARLRTLRAAAGLSQKAVWTALGVSNATYSNWESGVVKELKGGNLQKVCAFYKVTPDYLLHGKGKPPAPIAGKVVEPVAQAVAKEQVIPINSLGVVPLISLTQAGRWAEVDPPSLFDAAYRWTSHVAEVGPRAYAVQVSGDVMEPEISDGSILIVDPDRVPEDGQVVIVRHQGDETPSVKRLVIDGSRRYLKPDNARYPVVSGEPNDVYCGVVVQVIKTLVNTTSLPPPPPK